MTVQHIARSRTGTADAILTVQAASLETRLSDATLAMFEKYMGTLFSRRKTVTNGVSRPRARCGQALILFRRTIAALRLA